MPSSEPDRNRRHAILLFFKSIWFRQKASTWVEILYEATNIVVGGFFFFMNLTRQRKTMFITVNMNKDTFCLVLWFKLGYLFAEAYNFGNRAKKMC